MQQHCKCAVKTMSHASLPYSCFIISLLSSTCLSTFSPHAFPLSYSRTNNTDTVERGKKN